MTNPFAKHKIRHLSPSSLNLWQGEPALWMLKYLHGIKDPAGPAAMRGTAIEAGLDVWLMGGRDLDKANTAALSNFAMNTNGLADDAHEAERALIPPMLVQAVRAFENADGVTARQVRVETWLDGIEVPIMGFCDYIFESGAIVDLKTTKSAPSTPRADHIRQVAVYSKARDGAPVALCYVTPKKWITHRIEPDQVEEAIKDMQRVAKSLRTILDKSVDAKAAAEFTAPNFDNFYWNETTKSAARSVWI